MKIRHIAFIVLLFGIPMSVSAVETRCGWIDNPSPANWWILDKDGSWTIFTMGRKNANDTMDKIEFTNYKEQVKTNGSYGYYCGCLKVDVDYKKKIIKKIYVAKQLPIKRCRDDKNLPKMK